MKMSFVGKAIRQWRITAYPTWRVKVDGITLVVARYPYGIKWTVHIPKLGATEMHVHPAESLHEAELAATLLVNLRDANSSTVQEVE